MACERRTSNAAAAPTLYKTTLPKSLVDRLESINKGYGTHKPMVKDEPDNFILGLPGAVTAGGAFCWVSSIRKPNRERNVVLESG